MDPFTLSLIIAWLFVRGMADDARFMVTGKPSPRQLYRQKHGPSAIGQIGNAVGTRIADRIRNGPSPAKPTKERPIGWREAKERVMGWASALGEEAKESAEEGRRRRREARSSTPSGGEAAEEKGREGRRRGPRWWEWAWPERDVAEPTPEPVRAEAVREDQADDWTVRTALPAGADADRERAGEPEREPAGTAGEVPRFDGQPEATRRWDGEPESEADRRFYDLRESGYTGAINQDGYPVSSGPDVDILDDLAARTDRRLAEERAAAGGGAVVPGEVLDDGRDEAMMFRSFSGVEVPIPPRVRRECSKCGRVMVVDDDLHVDEGTGGAMVGLRCPSCGISSYGSWALSDEGFEAVFGYRFGECPDDEDEFTPGAAASTTNVPGHLNLEGSPAEKEGANMSAPVAEHGLTAFQNYVAALDGSCDEAIASLEQTIASMVTDGFSGEAIAGLEEAKDDLFPAIKGALARVAAALEQSNTVKDAYQGAMHTGHRDSVLAE